MVATFEFSFTQTLHKNSFLISTHLVNNVRALRICIKINMNEFFKFFLIVSTFVFNACCMNPSNLGLQTPPPPENVEFGECFVVPKIASGVLNEAYNYHHICPREFSAARPLRPHLHEKDWYVVGKLKDSVTPSEDQPSFDYAKVEQASMKFTFLKDTVVKFTLESTDIEYKITFQSLQQSQAFYRMVYEDVILSPAAFSKIDVLHEVMAQEMKKIGNNIEAQEERINNSWYTTFKDERGHPLLIFCLSEASTVSIKEPQLLWRIHTAYYILTFSNNAEARQFNADVGSDVSLANVRRVDANIRAQFYRNQITIDS